MGKVGFAEAVATLQYEHILEPTRAVDACEEPTEYVITLYVGGMEAKFASFCLNFIFRDHGLLMRLYLTTIHWLSRAPPASQLGRFHRPRLRKDDGIQTTVWTQAVAASNLTLAQPVRENAGKRRASAHHKLCKTFENETRAGRPERLRERFRLHPVVLLFDFGSIAAFH